MAIMCQALMDMFYRQNPEFVGRGLEMQRPNDEVKGIRLMPLSEDLLQGDYLYLVSAKQFGFVTTSPEESWIILVSDDADEGRGNVPVIPGDFSHVFNAFCAAFDSLSKWEKNVDLSLSKGDSLQQILTLSAEMIETPILIYDPSMKFLAHINERSYNNPWFHDIEQRGYMIEDIFSNMSNLHIFENLEKDGEAIINAENQKTGTYTKIKLIKSSAETLGYVFAIYYNLEQMEAGVGLFKMLCDKVQLSLERGMGTFPLRQDYLYDYFLSDILDGNLTDPEDISIRFRYVDIIEGRHYVLLSLCFQEDSKIPLGYIAVTMKDGVQGSYFFHYEEQPYLILHLQKEDGVKERQEKLQVLESFLRQFNCVAIASESFDDIMQLSYARSQTDMGKWLYINGMVKPIFGNVIRVEDCKKEQMMLLCLNSAPAEAWIHPAIKQIIQDDKDRNMKYIDFLNVYRKANCEVVATADNLFMHRSNVTYHLGKVKERYGLDVGDTEQCFAMVWSLTMLEFAEKLKKDS